MFSNAARLLRGIQATFPHSVLDLGKSTHEFQHLSYELHTKMCAKTLRFENCKKSGVKNGPPGGVADFFSVYQFQTPLNRLNLLPLKSRVFGNNTFRQILCLLQNLNISVQVRDFQLWNSVLARAKEFSRAA